MVPSFFSRAFSQASEGDPAQPFDLRPSPQLFEGGERRLDKIDRIG
jgi:hypothetical protein